MKQIREERVLASSKNLGIPLHFAQKIDKIINKREYDREQQQQHQLDDLITEMEATFSSLQHIDTEADEMALLLY